MGGREGVALVVPDRFEAVARVMHPLATGARWETVAPEYLGAGAEPLPYPLPEDIDWASGDMGPDSVDLLVPVLSEATSTPERCHFALWGGWGVLHPGSQTLVTVDHAGRQNEPVPLHEAVYAFVDACAVQPWWGGRDMLLFDGPVDAVASIGTPWPLDGRLERRGPQWWWPEDRSWFVGTEIDHPWTYVAGATELIETVRIERRLEAVGVTFDARW
jgi:hypothetical protein